MVTGLDVDLGVLEGLEVGLNEPMPCEHKHHRVDIAKHSGDGEWYVSIHTPCCKGNFLVLFCNKWIEYVLKPGVYLSCSTCDKSGYAPRELYKTITRKE